MNCSGFCSAALLALSLTACSSAGGGSTQGTTAAIPTFPERSQYDGLIARYAAENGVPVSLAHAIVEKESGYNAGARGRGTIGLMQIKPATARSLGYRGSASGLYDPETNLRWGMNYLGGAYRLGGGDVCGAALRYQGGHRATRTSSASRAYCADLKARIARRGG